MLDSFIFCQWFEEKQQQFENLDQQLKKLHASVEALVCHRKGNFAFMWLHDLTCLKLQEMVMVLTTKQSYTVNFNEKNLKITPVTVNYSCTFGMPRLIFILLRISVIPSVEHESQLLLVVFVLRRSNRNLTPYLASNSTTVDIHKRISRSHGKISFLPSKKLLYKSI